GTRPNRDSAYRGTDRRTAAELHDCHRHTLNAASGPRFPAHSFLPSGQSCGRGADRSDLHQPGGKADAGLHHRSLRLMVRKGQMMGQHTVTSFDEDLNAIDRLVHDMGDLAADMVVASTRSLVETDAVLAQRVISDDAIMDARQRELDDRAITLIAKRQPVAQDLRAVVGAIRMAADLERIGDLAKNISKRVSAVGEGSAPRSLSHSIDAMAQSVVAQVHEVIAAYEGRDSEKL